MLAQKIWRVVRTVSTLPSERTRHLNRNLVVTDLESTETQLGVIRSEEVPKEKRCAELFRRGDEYAHFNGCKRVRRPRIVELLTN